MLNFPAIFNYKYYALNRNPYPFGRTAFEIVVKNSTIKSTSKDHPENGIPGAQFHFNIHCARIS
jgi:hypothetical protein